MIRLVIVDDHGMVRAGIRGGLPADIEVVGEAADVQSAVSVIAAQEPDVVLLDVHLPGGNAQAVLQQSSVDSRFLALSVSDASQDVIGVVRLGARGYVTKDITSADLATAIRQVAAGEAVFSPRLAGFVLDAFTGAAAKTDDELDRLTAGSATSCV